MTPALSRLARQIFNGNRPNGSARSPSSSNHDNQRGQLRKRHWVLGSLVILVGSWITHTSTATISSDLPVQPALSLGELSSVELSPSDSGDSINTLNSSALLNSANESAAATQAQPVVAQERFETLSHTIKRGESLGTIFRKHKLNLNVPYRISQHELAKQLVSLRVGKTLQFKLDDQQELRQVVYPSNSLQELVVNLKDGMIGEVATVDLPYSVERKTISGEISSSLYEAGLTAGMSNGAIMEMVRIFGWDIDFVQDIRVGDSFHVIHTDYVIDGKKIADGNILAAEFTTQGQRYRAIRFEDTDSNVSYYTPEGESMLGTFLRSPVEFSRISSRFGKRRHPISKKWKAHKGVDYAAGRGTPIRATADGKVALAGRKGGYGKTVVLRHAGRFSTLYAHMNGFAKGVRSGSRVKQGQVIGYVGSTGYSTGPHLHYEFRVDGVHRNSLTYKTPKASSIEEAHKASFGALSQGLLAELSDVTRNYQLANLSTDLSTKISTKVSTGSAKL